MSDWNLRVAVDAAIVRMADYPVAARGGAMYRALLEKGPPANGAPIALIDYGLVENDYVAEFVPDPDGMTFDEMLEHVCPSVPNLRC